MKYEKKGAPPRNTPKNARTRRDSTAPESQKARTSTQKAAVGEQLALLLPPPRDFNPKWPNVGTQDCEVLDRLLTGERINPVSFMWKRQRTRHSENEPKRWRLAANIHRLDKHMGWPIEAGWLAVPGYDNPIKEYWLDTDAIMQAKALREGK